MGLSQLRSNFANSLSASAAALLLIFISGCASHSHDAAHDISDPDLLLTLQIHPVHPRQLDPTQFEIRLSDRSGKPVQDAVLIGKLEMPSMEMGENRVTLQPTAPGVYRGTGRFTMAGSWQITVQAHVNSKTVTKHFPIEVQ